MKRFYLLAALCVASFFPLALRADSQPPSAITLRDFTLLGQLNGDRADFTLEAVAHVEDRKGGSLELLSGVVALTEIADQPKWQIRAEGNRYLAVFERSGDFPVRLRFAAAVRPRDGWKSVEFHVAPAPLQPVVLQGLAADTQFQFAGAARPERKGSAFTSFLPADGRVSLAWKESRPEAEGKLFFAAEMLSQITVSPGLMRQVDLLDFKVMQGELSRVSLSLRGDGEVTRVQGEQVLSWKVNSKPDTKERELVVQFNQPQKDQFTLQLQLQTPLGAFPQVVDAVQVRPDSATRFAGHIRVVNEGAVRLEVTQVSGLSQISPEQFPETEATKAAFRAPGPQRFAYRFSGSDFALRIQADQILPELSVSEVLTYHLAESELDLDAEIELDIREAPLRDLTLHVPKGYAIAKLTASGLSDYFLREPTDQPESELRLVFGQPISGRQVIQLRLEHNQPLGATNWTLPRLEVAKAKSVRGHIGVSSDAGFRLTPERTLALTEIATAFFPRKTTGLQSAFRLSEPAWEASMRVERLPKTVQAEVLHLFSIGEGIAYGSSVLNYQVSGAPISTFKIELSDEYKNIEFTGKDLRNWQKTDGGFLVQLHTPVSGSYTLLATYERPFKAQGETLTFTGARPLDAQAEQGHTLIVSAYQFQVKPAEVSAGLLPLETGEVPAEYRLFFDAPILAAYRYNARPFNLKLALSPLAQGDSLSQVVDRAIFKSRISKEGQVITDVQYFVKNRGTPHFRLTLPPDTQLWSATVNGAAVVPVIDGTANLIPLPAHADPNAILQVDIKLASRSPNAAAVTVATPSVGSPVLLAEWKVEPDEGRRLIYRGGSLKPLGAGPEDVSGFAGFNRLFREDTTGHAWLLVVGGCLLMLLATLIWRSVTRTITRTPESNPWGLFALGLVLFLVATAILLNLGSLASIQATNEPPRDLTFLAPIQQSGGSLGISVANVEASLTTFNWLGHLWPALLAVAIWLISALSLQGAPAWLAKLVGWGLLAWTALRWSDGATAFVIVLLVFLVWHVAIPCWRKLAATHRKPGNATPSAPGDSGAPVAALIVGSLLLLGWGTVNGRAETPSGPSSNKTAPQVIPAPVPTPPPVADSIRQEIRIEDKFALATARIRWHAQKGDRLPLLAEPAVLTHLVYPTRSLKLATTPGTDSRRGNQLLAEATGTFDIEMQYELRLARQNEETGIILPTPGALVNQIKLTLANLEMDVVSPRAVSIQRDQQAPGSNTVVNLLVSPEPGTWIGWKPRSRDVKQEKAVFYAEFYQLYIPAPGVIEGVHFASIRPAQGELGELVFNVPQGTTITDVMDPSPTKKSNGAPTSIVSLWRFDPDTRKLRVTLNPAQSRPFSLAIRSQLATGPLPLEKSVGLISVEGAAGQIGLLGISTGNEVQLDTVQAASLSPVNLEDYPAGVAQSLASQIAGLTLRRAFRYSDSSATASLRASAVEPDVRVESQDTLSLGEDRTVLAANLTADITRAGIFRLSFALPTGFEVESVSGPALSHWSESKTDTNRIITLHLKGKTEGQQQFAISLTGPGVKAATGWAVPQLLLREAAKQRGTLVVVPEQGMRLQVNTRDGLTQLDPQRSGIRQKGVLAFRVLQSPWTLSLDLEQVEPWIQVSSLQHATVNEAQVKVLANLQYQIENTGLKSLRVLLPTNADSVHFQGDQIADFLAVPGLITNGLQGWEIKLQRRVIGQYMLQANYLTLIPEKAPEIELRGVQAVDVNLQRGFVTVQAAGRLQVRTDALPASLQPTEWQSIPRALQQDLTAANASLSYRLVEPAFQLALKLDRHEAAKLLPARVNTVTFTSVISDDGAMLTHVQMELIPGDKRLLHLTLPKNARFWFAFVNHDGVWPWRENDRILIPLEQQSRGGSALPVELFYSVQIDSASRQAPDLSLIAPKFDLPLEDLTWRVYLDDRLEVKKWTGSFQLETDQVVPASTASDMQDYLKNEAAAQQQKTKEAEQMLFLGNSLLEKGDPQQARRAFQSAYGLSQGDLAFNEDARVQLNNLKLQQALVGLNVRQAANAGETGAAAGKFRDLRGRKNLAYTQQDAKDILNRNTADDNAAFMKLAERLIQQQDAAVSSPAAIRASVPEQGRLLTFKRKVAIDPWADLNIRIETRLPKTTNYSGRIVILAGTIVFLVGFGWAGRKFRQSAA